LGLKSINQHLRIYEKSQNQFCLFDEKSFYELLEGVIMVLSANLASEMTVTLDQVL